MLAAYQGQQAPDKCARLYIEHTFDVFANSFDDILNRLKYSGPQLVEAHLAAHKFPIASLNVADLGCGAGLIGEVIHVFAQTMVGVDLSQAMLDRCAAKHLYSQLIRADITEFLLGSQDQYDLITCMDTFIYMGPLDDVCSLIYQRLKPGGLLFFSTEKLDESYEASYRLNINGRYSHGHDYLGPVLDSVTATFFIVAWTASINANNELDNFGTDGLRSALGCS